MLSKLNQLRLSLKLFDPSRYWYQRTFSFFSLPLLPLAWLFGFIVMLRRFLYRHGIMSSYTFSVPTIIVGNITVGGTGKTPFVIWLAHYLTEQGYAPGIVTRGVGGILSNTPHFVQLSDLPQRVGDEAILLQKSVRCPVVICKNKVAAVRALLQQYPCDVVISDDGLQHYRLGRHIEIAIIDEQRGFGNKHLLPAGPLREPIKRLKQVTFQVINGNTKEATMSVEARHLVSLYDEETKQFLTNFAHQTVHAVAAIGHPERFFSALRKAGLKVIPHIFPDHYLFKEEDFKFDDRLPIIMTEKDATKCRTFADERYWYLGIAVKISPIFAQDLLQTLKNAGGPSCD
ncbi:MAG: tetraacyldisaccharide 4'-kinase [Gammaproteobacteria bacterium]|nr:tetraacyldisaccharide 4'-kinase [Gammaproteobacteria bacterium]